MANETYGKNCFNLVLLFTVVLLSYMTYSSGKLEEMDAMLRNVCFKLLIT